MKDSKKVCDNTNKAESFKKELKELLVKYNASISFTCSEYSDTYGLYDDHIVIEMDDNPVIESTRWQIDASDF